MKNIKIYICIAALSFLMPSCKDFLDEDQRDRYNPDNFPKSQNDLLLGIAGAMYPLGSQDFYDRAWYFGSEVQADLVEFRGTTADRVEMDEYTYSALNQWVTRPWMAAYASINAVNVLIDRIPNVNESDAIKNRYEGAARFIRALNYFNLVRLYGDLPLMDKPAYDFSTYANIRRTNKRVIYNFIEQDLAYAIEHLPLPGEMANGFPTKTAAKAMLIDVSLQLAGSLFNESGYWGKAHELALDIYRNENENKVALFDPATDPDGLFGLFKIVNKAHPEYIFSIQFDTGGDDERSLMNVTMRPGGVPLGDEAGFGYWQVPIEFYNSISDNDRRKEAYILTNIPVKKPDGTIDNVHFTRFSSRGGKPAPRIKKWFDAGRENFASRRQRTDNNYPIYRYAEVLLWVAETENELNGPTGLALEALNKVRVRAGIPAVSGLGAAALRELIKEERKIELCFESKRKFDLIRWGDFYRVLSKDEESKVGITPEKYILPVPQNERLINPALGQNPGY